MMAKKKTFNNDLSGAMPPAMQFISPQPEAPKPQPTGEVPENCYVNPFYIERKSRRLQVLLKPSTYEKLKRRANRQTDGSVNEALNLILEEALKEE